MIKLITGKKGTGKTKILIDMINDAVKSTNGCLVCIEKGETLRREISYKVRSTASTASMVSLPVCSQATTI